MSKVRDSTKSPSVTLSALSLDELGKRLAPKPSKTAAEGDSNAVLGSDAARSRPAQLNLIIPCFSKEGRARVFDELALFFEVHPSRFFLVDLRLDAGELSCSFGEPIGDLAGNQVVVFEGGLRHLPEICGLLRAHLLIGVHTELALLDGGLLPAALTSLLPLCDGVGIESHLFDHLGGSGWGDGRAALFKELLKARVGIVDSGWLRLSTLREELRRSFEHRGFTEPAKIRIGYAGHADSGSGRQQQGRRGLPTVAVLMAGWCCDRLGAQRIAPTSSGAYAELDDGRRVEIEFAALPVTTKGANILEGADVTELAIEWRNGRIAVRIDGGVISTEVEGRPATFATTVHSERPIELEGDKDRWRRYFVIGESITNYRSSLQLATALFY
jgi:hypothetical protein